MTETVKFDPGIGELVLDFNNYINNIYSNLMSLHSPHQKRIQFKLYANKILDYIKNNISFYKGCLLWAYYIVKSNENSPKEITGNIFLNMTDEEKENYDCLMQVNFLENYFDSFERDTTYYLGKKILIPDNWKKILTIYSEFLEVNRGFINTKNTSDIVLPDKIKLMNNDLSYIKNLIDNVILSKNLNLFVDDQKLVI